MMGQEKALYQLILRPIKRNTHVRVNRIWTITRWSKNGLWIDPKKENSSEVIMMGKGKQKKKKIAAALRISSAGFFQKKS